MKSAQTRPPGLKLYRVFFAMFTIVTITACSVVGIRSTEEPVYSVLQNEDRFEVRSYEAIVIAETLVDADFDEAGDIAFRRLFAYISGDNKSAAEISMTAPVMALDEARGTGEKISMTAPVTGEKTARGWRYAFVLPSDYTIDTAPIPDSPEITLKRLPARQAAVVRYSGSWGEGAYEKNLAELRSWMRQNNLEADSLPRVAGYDPPWTLPFLRRNEIIIDIKS